MPREALSTAATGQFASNSGPELLIDGISIVYHTSRGPLTALRGLTMHVADGEFVAVLGPSGCGKSTLLKVVSGLLAVSDGRAALGGKTIDGPRKDVGIVFQQANLLPWKTVIDNVLVPIRALGHSVSSYK